MGSLLSTTDADDPIHQRKFFMHDKEANFDMDVMTYTVYNLANRDAAAFVRNETLLPSLVDRVFTTFFQHFVSANASLSAPSWAYQPLGAKPEELGRRLFYNRTEGMMRRTDPPAYAQLDSSPTVEAIIQHDGEILKMNAVATWLCVTILACLVLAIAAISVMQGKFLRPLQRNVDCLADTMVLVAGSEKLLAMVGDGRLHKNSDYPVSVRLGWFRAKNGDVRWGIEVVEDVEWVDAPGTVTREKSTGSIKRQLTRVFTRGSK